ncbi:hypothetical protein G7054_g13613 [Neopestalotiopsis clavispora]|nr:hypothetical protein G7054_g13613 [Neopestalotiopsis clavispora]
MDKNSRIVIVGAGIFGLSAAHQLASDGFSNILVLDRHMPPAPDASSNDISRIVRFDYADEDYLDIAHEAYLKWRDEPKYNGVFYPTPYILACNQSQYGRAWVEKTTAALRKRNLPIQTLRDGAEARKMYPTLTGDLASPGFVGYTNKQAGWADATKGTTLLRDECIQAGVSFISGRAGTVVGLETDSTNKITAVRTLAGSTVEGDLFVLTAGAWVSSLVPMYGSALATAQALGYIQLTDDEMEKFKALPIYVNCATGFFNFPPHEDTKMLKVAVHGWGYTRSPENGDLHSTEKKDLSMPPLPPRAQRANFVPGEAEARLRQGLREILPELGDRPFDRLALCWYTDTPTGDFIMDYHPDYKNLFVGGGCSGHAFKFMPVLPKYMGQAIQKTLPDRLSAKWRFRKEFQGKTDAFLGDGSRGGPLRRELTRHESAKL